MKGRQKKYCPCGWRGVVGQCPRPTLFLFSRGRLLQPWTTSSVGGHLSYPTREAAMSDAVSGRLDRRTLSEALGTAMKLVAGSRDLIEQPSAIDVGRRAANRPAKTPEMG
jgi:hypothetical protein